jgi:hypothetical protein
MSPPLFSIVYPSLSASKRQDRDELRKIPRPCYSSLTNTVFKIVLTTLTIKAPSKAGMKPSI